MEAINDFTKLGKLANAKTTHPRHLHPKRAAGRGPINLHRGLSGDLSKGSEWMLESKRSAE
jgi:hypothetical protein